MRPLLIIPVLAVLACNNAPLDRYGPPYDAEERAYQLVWEGAYGMERESRPATVWLADCANPAPRVECVIAYLSPDGEVSVTWKEGRLGTPRIANTPWPEMLGSWRVYLLTGKRGDADVELAGKARELLSANGL